ncbi:hypothetical protein B4V02_13700 [Paenibacillus kribbensis]|uniref:Uncharacterized protein n=1 Tax=Paenibacillus kribbensis TaxID=172713 RepID=A0A222WNU9_9BACL|nr:hypothetical protein [Paenibacillus kribbensis]ASR47652.1 hypothetical protein B4V02_13700 [Paenibacillus kribbensis]
MFELQDLLPYLFTIGLLCTVTYAYLTHLHGNVPECWVEGGAVRSHASSLMPISARGQDMPVRLARHIRRKEAPDEDTSDCFPSLNDSIANQRGGTYETFQGIHLLG